MSLLWNRFSRELIGALMGAFGMAGLLFGLAACGKNVKAAAISNVTAERIYGSDGSTCYVILQGETAVGGNCIPD